MEWFTGEDGIRRNRYGETHPVDTLKILGGLVRDKKVDEPIKEIITDQWNALPSQVKEPISAAGTMVGTAIGDTLDKSRTGLYGPSAFGASWLLEGVNKATDWATNREGFNLTDITRMSPSTTQTIADTLITRKLSKVPKINFKYTKRIPRNRRIEPGIEKVRVEVVNDAIEEGFSPQMSLFKGRNPKQNLIPSYENRPVYIPKSELAPFQKGEPLMTTTGGNQFSDEEIASSLAKPEFDQTTIDPKGKVDDRSYITEWFTRRRKKDKSRRDTYDYALSLRQPEKSSRAIKEKFAGNLLVQDVEKVAKELNLETSDEGITYEFSPLDVYRYITREETLHENIIQSVTMLNDIAFPGNMQIVDAKIKQLEEENVMKPGTHDKFLKQLIRFRETSGETTFPQKQVGVDSDGNPVTVIDWSKLNQVKRKGRFQRPWSKGHIKALATIFSEGLTGADVHTNLFLEPYWSQYITDPTGATTLIKGNAANADLQDAPLYVQVLLEGKSWDLKDDFLKSVTPDSLVDTYEIEKAYLDKGESIKLEYQEVAKIMYNKLLSKEGLKNWRIDIDLNKLAKGRNAELLKSYAAAQGIKAYMEAFDKAVKSRKYRIPTGQPLTSTNLNDWWLAGKWTAGNERLKDRLDRILVREIKKALKEKNVDLIEKTMTEDEMKDLLDETHPER